MLTTHTFSRIRFALLAALAIGCLMIPKVERALLSGVRAVTPFNSATSNSATSNSANAERTMPALRDQQAIDCLRAQGLYASLKEAMVAARYEIKPTVGPRVDGNYQAANPAQQLTASFAPDQIGLRPSGEQRAQWQLGLKLVGCGYGRQLEPVSAAWPTVTKNRIEYRRTFNTTATGAPTPTVTCTPASGSAFPLGVTTVNCSVKDAANNSSSCGFTVTVNKVSVSASDPLACTGPGNVVKGTIQLTNNGNATTNAAMTTSLPAGLLALPGTCAASVGACTALNASTITYTGAIPAGQTATITYQSQVGDQVTTGTQLCATSSVSFNGGPVLTVQACVTATCPAVGPGVIPDAKAPVSDQGAGSVLVYNLYTSSATSGNSQNARINLTNIHPVLTARAHLFFVDGANCSVADSFVCLTPNQTTSFLASDLDPGTSGYIVVVAVNSQGCPTNFNYLIGDEYVKLSTGHAANLGAEAFSALAGGLPLCNDSSVTAQLNFDGISYDQAPRVLALSNIPSRADGNDTLLVLNRIGGNLGIGASTLTNVFGIFYDDTENGVSFTFNPGACQFRSSVTNTFPRITPRFDQFVPSGRSGWLKLYSTNDQGILGAAINFNGNAGTSAGAFSQGHNLHKLTLTSSITLTIPIFPPSC